jgi:hypothetical protein
MRDPALILVVDDNEANVRKLIALADRRSRA